eukprot:TRINITY_DN1764_c0_g1_i2.p1 TRINITY_DN1764_c0_g1~~TRINITY_DN1764_c0_g1_i2.p1  ORF type:complete len:315 (+),score=38.86 TRINITY_DN1764_c0_g1_i2:10-954(+)
MSKEPSIINDLLKLKNSNNNLIKLRWLISIMGLIWTDFNYDLTLVSRVFGYFICAFGLGVDYSLDYERDVMGRTVIGFFVSSLVHTRVVYHWVNADSWFYVLYVGLHLVLVCMLGAFVVDKYNDNYGKEVAAIVGPFFVSVLSLLVVVTRFKLTKIPFFAIYIQDFAVAYEFGVLLLIGFIYYAINRNQYVNMIKPTVIFTGAYLLPMCISTFLNVSYWTSLMFDMEYEVISYDNFLIIFIDGLVVYYLVFTHKYLWKSLDQNLKGLKYIAVVFPLMLFLIVVQHYNLANYVAPIINETESTEPVLDSLVAENI